MSETFTDAKELGNRFGVFGALPVALALIGQLCWQCGLLAVQRAAQVERALLVTSFMSRMAATPVASKPARQS